ncbi:MAG: class I SAM-dependent methyltransferase [Gemmataceae bacterium]
MDGTERLAAEIAFHDQQARQRQGRFRTAADFRFGDADYLDHETWIRPAMERLGNVTGQRVLDLGCGHAMASVVLARRGADVTAMDVSGGYLAEAGRRAAANGVAVRFVQADGERLPFADATFDRVWGNAVLHHFDLARAGGEVRRVLRPGGVAVFCEPWGDNPLLAWARRRLPYPGKHRTRDEQPLSAADLGALRVIFPTMTVDGYQLLGMARRVLGRGAVSRGLDWLDDRLLRHAPALSRFCRYVVLTLSRVG